MRMYIKLLFVYFKIKHKQAEAAASRRNATLIASSVTEHHFNHIFQILLISLGVITQLHL